MLSSAIAQILRENPVSLSKRTVEGVHGTSLAVALEIVSGGFRSGNEPTLRLGNGVYFYSMEQPAGKSAAEFAKTYAHTMGHFPIAILSARTELEQLLDFEDLGNQAIFAKVRAAIGHHLGDLDEDGHDAFMAHRNLFGYDAYEWLDKITVDEIARCVDGIEGMQMYIRTVSVSHEQRVVCVKPYAMERICDVKFVEGH